MTERLNRREFLNLNWESTLGFLGNFLAPQMEIERDFFRPPGSCGELEFLTSCTRCGQCQDICPEQSIRLFTLENGAKLVNTPYMVPNESPCTFCKKCIEICPTGSLNLTDFAARPALGYVKVQKDRCLGYQNVMCDYCVRSCPVSGAIRIENSVPVVLIQHCTGCGICVSHCIAEGSALKVMMKED
ncbi:Ferredoxin-type protein NapG [Neobacillus rhizosphaerae]|jgi:MauM/NapG family ferredoxin protein|uniref:Ferredoxin-type protein NapG n=1 Tax=Neobacillus rhizosphaerae TaxID=2880965 RepID=A0ABM9EJZ0_9BACI|nr:4Fe-4S dicluster domain-containing protein [Neobacillus rhizosphaerae]CAH2712869.1 Ferredoxin-type protein NapG [Neobacillus rhizosphaerae]